MTCPTCGAHSSHQITGSAWGGPLSDGIDDRRATTYYPCGCIVEDDEIPWRDVPKPRNA